MSACGGTAVRIRSEAPARPPELHLTPAGSLLPPPGPDRFTPTLMAVDPRGRLLVADEARGTIFAYDDRAAPPVGWLAAPTGNSGSGPRFVDIRGIVGSTGLNIFVLDGGSGRVYQYDQAYEARGQVLDLASSRVTSRFGAIRGTALGLDPSGQPIVADAAGDRLLVFDPQWSPRFEMGAPGASAGAFRDPAAVVVAPGGRIWVADRGNGLVQVLDPVGTFLAEHALDHAPESLAIDPAGNVFIGDAAGIVTILGRGGARQVLAPAATLRGTAYVALRPDGRQLYVARPVAGLVEVYDVRPATDGS